MAKLLSHKKVEFFPSGAPSRAIRIPKLSDLWAHPLGLRQSAPGWEILDLFMGKYGKIMKN